MDSPQKPNRKWQNLLYKKCPNCDTRLENSGQYYKCPEVKTDGRNCFFIKKEKAAEFLLDPEHPAYFCLTAAERATVESVVSEMGFDPMAVKRIQHASV